MVSSWQSFINKLKERKRKMQKYITRTIDFTKISGFVMQIGGDNEKISVDPILEVGKIDEKRATKIF